VSQGIDLANFLQRVTVTENPRVGGSIPPLATNGINILLDCPLLYRAQFLLLLAVMLAVSQAV